MRFLLFSDLHHNPGKYPGRAEGALELFEKEALAQNCDFIIHAGDFCHGPTKVPEYVEKYNNLSVKAYHCLGNHEADNSSFEDILRLYKLEKDYYYFDISGYRMIVLNPNYFYSEGKYINYSMKNYFGEDRDYLPPEQIEWLRETIADSEYPCILISHESFERDNGVKNRQDVLDIINEANRRRPHSVILCINGHYHKDYLRILDGVCYLDMNSASFDAVGNSHNCYPAELHAEYFHAKDSIIYTDKLYAIVTLEGNTIDIKGNSSSYYLGITHEMTGNSRFDCMGRENKPMVLSARIEL